MQSELDYGVHDRVDRAVDALSRVVQDAIDAIGPTVAAGVCGVRYPQISDALAGREGRRFPAEWALAIATIAPEEMRRRIAAALIEPLGYVLERKRVLTPTEKLARLRERVLAKLGPLGAEIVGEDL